MLGISKNIIKLVEKMWSLNLQTFTYYLGTYVDGTFQFLKNLPSYVGKCLCQNNKNSLLAKYQSTYLLVAKK